MQVKLVLGYPSSGKSSHAKIYLNQGWYNLNRDTEGGTIIQLLPKLDALLDEGRNVVLDNLFPTIDIRRPFIEMAKKHGAPISVDQMMTSCEDSQFNFINRMIDISGKFLMPEEIKKSKHPNIFPPGVFFKYKKEFQKPCLEEGFSQINLIPFKRELDPKFTNKALILDYDGTLRECINGNGKYPVDKSQIEIKKGRTEVLKKYQNDGFRLLGVSNQSGIAKGELSHAKAQELFNYTNELLGVDIEVAFCPHPSGFTTCYCRKPMCGWFVHFMRKYNLNPSLCQFVGDLKTDCTFSARCGMQYTDQADFFK